MKREGVPATGAPVPLGPYQVALKVGEFVFTSGQLGIDPKSGELEMGIEAQTHRVLKNISVVLENAGTSLASVVKTTVFLANLDDFAAMNAVYAQYFPSEPPARSTVQVARMPKSALVQIEAVACIE